jgi:hypothetical protein
VITYHVDVGAVYNRLHHSESGQEHLCIVDILTKSGDDAGVREEGIKTLSLVETSGTC